MFWQIIVCRSSGSFDTDAYELYVSASENYDIMTICYVISSVTHFIALSLYVSQYWNWLY